MPKILLDTDIGTDVDDAVCLAYLLSRPDCELLGITTVTGEPEKRAMLASVLCLAAGRPKIPIFPGLEVPLVGVQRQQVAQQAVALPRWPHRSDFPHGEAINFLHRTIHANPGEVVLLSIGPLTNIGKLFLSYPEIPALLKGLVLMGGCFYPQQPDEGFEWNVGADPQASEAVYRASIRLHRSVGLDVTQRIVLPAEAVRQRFTAPLLKPVLDFAEVWFAQFYPSITFHDPLAAATIFDESLCTYAQGTVTIDQEMHPGQVIWREGASSAPHQIAVSVDRDRYLDHFFHTLR